MYIFECIWKLFLKKTNNDEGFIYDPLNQVQEDESYERCHHDFMPVDSTGETLACIKCGFIVKRSNIEEGKTDYGSNI